MPHKDSEPGYWDKAAQKTAEVQEFDSLLAEQYRSVHLNLINRWADVANSSRILKTDLFAEAVHPHRSFLWDLLKANNQVIGIDISAEVTAQAKSKALQYAPGSSAQYINCDVRHLPFASNSFDLIISDSTLDHFHHSEEIVTALSELSRVLQPGGTLIITMDNKSNITEIPFRLWLALGLHPFFIGKTYSQKELNQALAKVGLQVIANTAIIHNPRFFARGTISLVRRISPDRFNKFIRRGLAYLDSFEQKRIKYLTAQFIAAKAVKPR